jgi:DNA-directed RNA polymerase specialized sigma24 family protein
MAVTSKSQEQHRISPEAAMLGVLALLIDEREQRIGNDKSAERTEVLLARVGLSVDDIAAAVGKKRDAVRMMITRKGK